MTGLAALLSKLSTPPLPARRLRIHTHLFPSFMWHSHSILSSTKQASRFSFLLSNCWPTETKPFRLSWFGLPMPRKRYWQRPFISTSLSGVRFLSLTSILFTLRLKGFQSNHPWVSIRHPGHVDCNLSHWIALFDALRNSVQSIELDSGPFPTHCSLAFDD